MLRIEIIEIIECKGHAHMRVGSKYIGIAGDNYELRLGVLCFYGFAHGSCRYALAYAAGDLEDYFHIFFE